MLSEEQVEHIAKLARLKLDKNEIATFSKQLSEILDYVAVLEKADTKNVAETSQVTGLNNVIEEDAVKRKCEGDELLECSELPKERNQIRVKPVITN
jgi:aspartyl-tRNA(Asn)/glutamyl-tRNA(Gln) amidotransferase subunit C